ncbi:TPA: AAA family ATPase, partial [Klebsiella aerogenes]|nr:AAA family ATPase [Klebsiella aerogenes]
SKSKYIKRAFDEQLKTMKLWNNETIVKNIHFNASQVEAVSYILGRKYMSIKFLEHRLWGTRGGTAMLSTDKLNYTEAYAGSGEFAVVSLIMNLSSAKERSLILLDEPEVSLHPGAQKRMMETIYQLVEKNKHQLILSTHSPVLVNMLPKEAIKLFTFDQETETTKISQCISPDEAFVELGHDISERTIIVEDKLAKEVIERAIKNDAVLNSSINVEYIPGGAETILSKHLPSYAIVGRQDIIFLMDGDKNKDVKKPKIDTVSDADLVATMKCHFGCELVINASGGNGVANRAELLKLQRTVLKYALDKVLYLPFFTPEQLLIDTCCTIEQKELLSKQKWDMDDVDVYKKMMVVLTQDHLGKDDVDSNEIFFTQKHMLSKLGIDSDALK